MSTDFHEGAGRRRPWPYTCTNDGSQMQEWTEDTSCPVCWDVDLQGVWTHNFLLPLPERALIDYSDPASPWGEGGSSDMDSPSL